MVVSTYQAASGAGAAAMAELELQTREVLDGEAPTCKVFAQQYAFNLFSHNSDMYDNGYNTEEMKMVRETHKIWGQAEGGSIAAQIIGRSNIFRAAVLVAPALFASTPQYRYAGLRRLASLTAQITGKQMTDGMLVRELRARDAFFNISKIKTSTLIISPENDPGAQELSLWVGALREAGVEHRVLPFPGMFPEFMTAADNGLRPPNWAESRETAWADAFSWIESYVPSAPGPAPAQ